MLPSDLLIARVRRGLIQPLYATGRYEELFIADQLIEAFNEHVGRRRGELESRLKEIEDLAFRIGCHYKFARGLIHLLMRRAEFKPPDTSVDPLKARMAVFEAAARRGGFALSEEERKAVLREAAEELGVSVEELWKAFTSAYEEEHVLARFDPLKPEELLRLYNLSLAQTLLFRALEMEARLEATGTEVKVILFNVKRLGLMYFAEQVGGELRLTIDGPASIIRQTERYGTRLAKLLPYLMAARRWSVRARIRRNGRVYVFRVDSSMARLFPRVEMKLEEYDSSVEEDFFKRFSKVKGPWKVYRELEPLVVNGRVLIPDFVFVAGDVKIYMEVLGFWTPDYVRRKLEKLRGVRGVKLIVAVNEELACTSDFSSLPAEVIVFRRRIPVDEVYRALKKFGLRPELKAREEVRVPAEALEYLRSIEEASLLEVVKQLRRLGVSEDEAVRAIEAAGLTIEWRGLDPKQAVVRRASR